MAPLSKEARPRASLPSNSGYYSQPPPPPPWFMSSSPAHYFQPPLSPPGFMPSSRAYYAQPPQYTSSSPAYCAQPPQFMSSSPAYYSQPPQLTSSSPAYYSQPQQPPVFIRSSSSLTPEQETQIYWDALLRSDGFDIPFLDGRGCKMCGMIQRIDLDREPCTRELVHNFSAAAIHDYNARNGTSYRVVNVEKAMRQLVSGDNYYITFQAKTDDDESSSAITKTFEALVYHSIGHVVARLNRPTKITLCRLQGDRQVSAARMTCSI